MSPPANTTARAARASRAPSERALFITRAYNHLFLAVAALVAIEIALFRSGIADRLAQRMLSVPWLLILAAFMLVGWLASRAAWKLRSLAGQYAGLATYVVAKAIILVPLLYQAERFAPGTIQQAAQWTLLGFTGLSAIAWITREDFSFLRPFLIWLGFVALLLIVAALLFGFHLGTWFSAAMIALAGASVLYDTDKIRRRSRTNRYVGAALSLFASVAMMFWYVLRILSRGGRL
jgi:FtsH-binding integral membrane protein